MTYKHIFRSHTGKAKDGKTFEKFLGEKVYDEKLKAFEKFLHSSFCEYHKKPYYQHKLTLMLAQEDCASRSLVKDEAPDEDKGLEMNDGKEGGHEEEGNGERLDEDYEQAGEVGTEAESASVPKPSGPSEYIKNKQKNIEELKRRLDEVNVLFPIEKVQPEKKKAKQTSRKSGSRGEPIVRRESVRNKDKRQGLQDVTCVTVS